MTPKSGLSFFGIVAWTTVALFFPENSSAQNPVTGPETEKRFPPLKLAKGFEATLFACDPLVEYPSVIALGPRPGMLFVAQDYMTGLGKEIVKRDEIRLIEDSDGDGYADKTARFAEGFNSIQGLAYDIGNGTVFVMHAPFLTMVRDTSGDGVADERRDLLEGLGLRPEVNETRLHSANGVTIGEDNWLYLALGDHGANVERPEGDRLVLEGGGILRCRPDGTQLHIFSKGLRNIYDVALDADLNVFVRDNENDGGDYKIRVYHSFYGADHGYPYKYYERPEETMQPLADLDLGSSAGGVCYLETAFPETYRGNLFFCDWNHSLVRYEVKPKGASFEPMEEFKVAEGGEGDLYPFKPSDVIVDWDGSLLVSDWADGQRPKRGRGRIYRITHQDGKHEVAADPTEDLSGKPLETLIRQLESASHFARAQARNEIERRREAYPKGKLPAFDRFFLEEDFSKADRMVLETISISSDREKSGEIRRLPELLLESTLIEAHAGLFDDPAFRHATMQALRRSGNWPAVLRFLDLPEGNPARSIAGRALGDQAEADIVDDLLDRLRDESGRQRLSHYVDLLARVHRKPGPWVYWEYRPGPRPPNSVDWERTEAIEQALDRLLELSSDLGLERFTLQRMQREQIPVGIATLAKCLEKERDEEFVELILISLREKEASENSPVLEKIILDSNHSVKNRLTALETWGNPEKLESIAKSLEDGPVLAALLRRAGQITKIEIDSLLLEKTASQNAGVRAAAVFAATQRIAIGERKIRGIDEAVLRLLADEEAEVRRSAASAAGMIRMELAREKLLHLAKDDQSAPVRGECLSALRLIGDGGAVAPAVRDLKNRETQLAALRYLAAFGSPDHAAELADAATRNRSQEMLRSAIGALATWKRNDEISLLQTRSGLMLRWKILDSTGSKLPEAAQRESAFPEAVPEAIAGGPDWIVHSEIPPDSLRHFISDLRFENETPVQFLAGSAEPFKLWVNGNLLFEKSDFDTFRPDAHRINAVLQPGNNRVVVTIDGSAARKAAFQLKFRKRSSIAAREDLTQAALTGRGNVERGRKLFFNRERSQCLACHQLGDEGGKIGPELTGMGGRFSRIYLIESILDPNANVTPGFKTLSLTKKDGTAMLGVKVSETEFAIVLGDAAGRQHEIPKAEIEEIRTPNISLMPAGLEHLYTRQEFLDLMAFLTSER